ncbi:hypothetical protein I4F81_005689 [Pyropia yezoensis]|uniref:Uncharacterized protein n=1 Tax=Pyropia yezoensis TaxID=2788 RepID=A0ACC3C004_PYRYE|nr:hypothetical protein I4F81_005689 [Neopyropia yezoensis]
MTSRAWRGDDARRPPEGTGAPPDERRPTTDDMGDGVGGGGDGRVPAPAQAEQGRRVEPPHTPHPHPRTVAAQLRALWPTAPHRPHRWAYQARRVTGVAAVAVPAAVPAADARGRDVAPGPGRPDRGKPSDDDGAPIGIDGRSRIAAAVGAAGREPGSANSTGQRRTLWPGWPQQEHLCDWDERGRLAPNTAAVVAAVVDVAGMAAAVVPIPVDDRGRATRLVGVDRVAAVSADRRAGWGMWGRGTGSAPAGTNDAAMRMGRKRRKEDKKR